MMRTTFLVGMVIAGFAFFSCSKSQVTNTGGGNNGGSDSSTDTTITPPNDPPVASTIGFFGNNWGPKDFTAPSFSITAKPTTAFTSFVTVDMSKVITKVSKNLFGNNSNLWMGQIVDQPSLMQYITDLSPNIIRGPAGSISDIYFFNQSSTPPADVPDSLYDTNGNKVPTGYWFGQNNQSWTLALNNYYQLLQQTKSTGILTVNYGYARYGTSANPVAAAAHLAADWVRYDNGRTKYWEIGNECYGNWEADYKIDVTKNKDGQPEIVTGDLYGQHVKIYADSMRAAAQEIGATIYIGAILLDAPAPAWQDNTNKTWNQGVLSEAGSTADFFIVHDYFTAYNTNSSATDILSTASSLPSTIMSYLKQQLSQYAVATKPIALTEWNIQPVGSKQDVSNLAGIHAVITLGELIKNQFGEAGRWDLANGWNNGNDQGLFNNTAGSPEPGASAWNPRPAFYHMYYFQKYFGDRMVTSTVTGSSTLLSYASSFSSGESGIVVINKAATNETVSIDIKNFRKGANYYWYTLKGGTNNGDFSGSVYVNGTAPTGTTGGPLNYASLKANAAAIAGGISISTPPRSVTFIVAETKK